MSALKIRKLNDNKKKIVTWKDHEENTSLTIRENTENIIERKTDYLNTLVGALQKGHIHLPLFSEQTHKLQMAAVTLDGLEICHVKNQTHDLCLEAVKQNGLALKYVKIQHPKICSAAINQNKKARHLIKLNTVESTIIHKKYVSPTSIMFTLIPVIIGNANVRLVYCSDPSLNDVIKIGSRVIICLASDVIPIILHAY